MSNERLGIFEEHQRRRLLYHGKPVAISAPLPVLRVRPAAPPPVAWSAPVARIIDLVARHADLSIDSIRGLGKTRRQVDARFVIANLAEEFAPAQPASLVDDAMLRASGMCIWYRSRHVDRCALFPEYGALYERCRADLLDIREARR